MNAVGKTGLEQLIIIFNEDAEEPNDENGVPLVYSELLEADMRSF